MSGDCMRFPATPEEFIKDYSFADKEQMYTNGADLVPVFRVEQMMEHYFPKWIPVTERLPEKYGFVLVYTIDKIVGEAVLINIDKFYWAGSDEDAEPIAVTHWMPLPEPPKEE